MTNFEIGLITSVILIAFLLYFRLKREAREKRGRARRDTAVAANGSGDGYGGGDAGGRSDRKNSDDWSDSSDGGGSDGGGGGGD